MPVVSKKASKKPNFHGEVMWPITRSEMVRMDSRSIYGAWQVTGSRAVVFQSLISEKEFPVVRGEPVMRYWSLLHLCNGTLMASLMLRIDTRSRRRTLSRATSQSMFSFSSPYPLTSSDSLGSARSSMEAVTDGMCSPELRASSIMIYVAHPWPDLWR